ncbi:MAG: B12-binding domain-containing radical SAM protein, partial [Promethearchaeota archaeon]
KTIIGGSHPTALPEECLLEGAVDYIVIGEGEETVKELCQNLIRGDSNFSKILGLAFKKKNKIYINQLRPLISDLDKIPMPAYHLLPGGLKSYHAYIDTSRGCVYECGFCSGPTYWQRKIRTRYFKNFYQELMLIKSLIGDYNFLHISDPMFGVTRKQVEIAKKLKNIKHNLYFSCDIKANYVTYDLIKMMIDCGIRIFSIGIETLNDKSLKLIKKNCSAQKEINACKIIKKFDNSFLKSYWIFGLPGENKSSLDHNVKEIYRLLRNNIIDQVCNHVLVPYPGTEFFNYPDRFGIEIIHNNWIRYEGRSFPLVYDLKSISGEDIYEYFAKAHENELLYYKERYPNLNFENNNTKTEKLSFSEYKGRLV